MRLTGVVADATDPQPEAEELTTAEADDAAQDDEHDVTVTVS